jgi:diadenosine tetraphosphate (Ap4A) HIT family hydrolase
VTAVDWEARKRGDSCPFCGVRPDESDGWSKVSKLSVATLYLQKIQTYRGHCVLVFDPRHVTRISELTTSEWSALSNDLYTAQRAIERATNPEHVNTASLGNIVPHLHWHIIPRYMNDSRWGGPIWTTNESEMEIVRLPDEEHRALVDAILAELRGCP